MKQMKLIKRMYKCSYPSCKDEPEFERLVGYDATAGKCNAGFSISITCPKGHSIPTWGKKLTGEFVGVKHQHPDRK